MYFAINIPYRKIIFYVRMEQTVSANKPADLSWVARRHGSNRRFEQEIERSRVQFFLLPR